MIPRYNSDFDYNFDAEFQAEIATMSLEELQATELTLLQALVLIREHLDTSAFSPDSTPLLAPSRWQQN